MNPDARDTLHPASEAVFTFPTYGGKVRPDPTNDALMTVGGSVPWAAFQKQCGLIETLVALRAWACCGADLRSAGSGSLRLPATGNTAKPQ